MFAGSKPGMNAMLSAATLNRVSSSYRRGYYAGHALSDEKNKACETYVGMSLRPFSDYDFTEGYKAGLNDRYWADFYSGLIKEDRKTFMAKYID